MWWTRCRVRAGVTAGLLALVAGVIGVAEAAAQDRSPGLERPERLQRIEPQRPVPALRPVRPERPVPVLRPVRPDRPGRPAVQLQCAPGADQDRTVAIVAPLPNGQVGAGVEIRWQRTGHELCSQTGTERRYVLAICRQGQACLPNNGLYLANILPAALGWQPTDLGRYTLSLEDVEKIRTLGGPPLAQGAPLSLQIRYNFKLGSTVWGDWVTRPVTLTLQGTGVAAPATPPILQLPETYGPTAPMTAGWAAVPGADHYRTSLVFRGGGPGGTDMGVVVGEAPEIPVAGTSVTRTEPKPPHTGMVVWRVVACNPGGCSPPAVAGVFVNPPAPAPAPQAFATLAPAFRAAACVNCHAVAATNFQNRPAQGYGTGDNLGLPPGHSPTNAQQNCAICHSANLMPQGSHPVPWQAAPASMDLRGKSDAELCQMARDPGTLAEDIEDHLLGDPLILWAVQGGPLPEGAGNVAPAFSGNWTQAVTSWVAAGAPCP